MAVALIVAAGSGERLGAGRPKALVPLAGRALLAWSLDALAGVAAIEQLVVALPEGVALPPGLQAPRAGDGAGTPRLVTVVGGATRSESVRAALAAAPPGDPVLVHDAARPLLTSQLAADVLAALARDQDAQAAIAAVPVSDTVKRVQEGTRVVAETLDRRTLWAVQTPQVFRREALEAALDVGDGVLAQATDDAWLVECAGGRVIVVSSSEDNVKVTTPRDLALAELLLGAQGNTIRAH
jgi:2-C-methyl-D-erythritol 4-phosphate cytidylyltransferase